MYLDDGKSPARVIRAEVRKGERGEEYGGAYYVAINGLAMGIGYDFQAKELADEIAQRWNSAVEMKNAIANIKACVGPTVTSGTRITLPAEAVLDLLVAANFRSVQPQQ